MEINLNNQVKELQPNISVKELLNEFCGDKQRGVAIAINETVVRRADWETTVLSEKDKVIIIRATQGG